jgi:hypothetical protein
MISFIKKRCAASAGKSSFTFQKHDQARFMPKQLELWQHWDMLPRKWDPDYNFPKE